MQIILFIDSNVIFTYLLTAPVKNIRWAIINITVHNYWSIQNYIAALNVPMLNVYGGPSPSMFVADIATSIDNVPFPMFCEQGNGSMLGSVQT